MKLAPPSPPPPVPVFYLMLFLTYSFLRSRDRDRDRDRYPYPILFCPVLSNPNHPIGSYPIDPDPILKNAMTFPRYHGRTMLRDGSNIWTLLCKRHRNIDISIYTCATETWSSPLSCFRRGIPRSRRACGPRVFLPRESKTATPVPHLLQKLDPRRRI